MNGAQQEFRERLLSLQKASPSEKYRREVAALQEKRLSPTQRAIVVFVTIGTLAAAVFMGWLAAVPPRPLPDAVTIWFGFLVNLFPGGELVSVRCGKGRCHPEDGSEPHRRLYL